MTPYHFAVGDIKMVCGNGGKTVEDEWTLLAVFQCHRAKGSSGFGSLYTKRVHTHKQTILVVVSIFDFLFFISPFYYFILKEAFHQRAFFVHI